MNSSFLRLIACLMVLVIATSCLVACGNDQQPATQPLTDPPTDAPTQPPTDAPTEPPTVAPTEAPTVAPTEPPATQPPATEPPATQPPATQPPATEPPAPTNDIGKEIAKDEFAITVLRVEQNGNVYAVEFTLTYTGDLSHSLSARERIFLVNADRRSLAVSDIFDANHNSLMGTSIEPGQTLTIRAEFTLTDGYVPTAFHYVYDIMGFRRLQAEF